MNSTVWYDREVSGGQAWWNAILSNIRDCDLFVFILTAKSLESQACRAEYTYASKLKKRILPVLCSEDVKVNLLPPELSVIQFVDYRAQDKQAAYAMIRALQNIPEAIPMPETLPSEPPVPLSYLGDLRAQVETDHVLTPPEQRSLFSQISARLKDSESRDDACDLLRLLRGREDLLASIAEDIDAVLNRVAKPQPAYTPPPPPPAPPVEEKRNTPQPLPSTMALDAGTEVVETLVKKIGSICRGVNLQAGEDSISVSVENGMYAVSAVFHRWTDKEAKQFRSAGWEADNKLLKTAAAGAVGVLGAATYGLGLGVLLHKGTREYVTRNVLIKRFLVSQEKDAAASVLQAFRILHPEARVVTVSDLP
jgi:hypothetical protein